MEQTNVLADLISRIQLSNTNSLSSLVLDKKSSSNFLDASNWTKIFKYGFLGLISFILSIILLYLIIFCIPFNKLLNLWKRKNPISETDIELMIPLRQGDTKPHNHSHTIIDSIKDLCWNDGCVIEAPSAPLTLIKIIKINKIKRKKKENHNIQFKKPFLLTPQQNNNKNNSEIRIRRIRHNKIRHPILINLVKGRGNPF